MAKKKEPTEIGKNPSAVALGKLGAKKGAEARAKSLTPEQRAAIAKKAAQTRWRSQRVNATDNDAER